MIAMSDNKKFVVEANIIEEAVNLNLSLPEFLLITYFENSDDSTFDIDRISKKLKVDQMKVLEAYNNLLTSGIVNLACEKLDNGKRIEKVTLDGFYERVKENKKNANKKKLKEDIFSIFEEKFKRPLNGTEFEVIKAWVEKMYDEEVILAALDEAVYNGATNIRYIDTILYEWSKKGIKTKDDIEEYHRNRFEERKMEETSVFDYNWLDDDK